MAFAPKFVDLVRNTTTTVGTGPIALGAAVDGYTGFAQALAAGDQFYYCIQGVDRPTEREVGRGTMQADGTIAREAIDGGLTNFKSGTKTIALVAAAEWYGKVSGGTGSVATRAALAASAGQAGAVMRLDEAGREGLFRFDGTNLSALVAADGQQGLYVAPASAPNGTSGAWVRIVEESIDPRWFGLEQGSGKGGANSSAIAGMMAVLRARSVNPEGLSRGMEAVRFPAGHYHFASTIDIDGGTMTVEGMGGSRTDGALTRLQFPAGVTGIRVQSHRTSGATDVVADKPGSYGSVIRGLQLVGGFAGADGEGHGVHLRAAARVEQVTVSGFDGNGIYITASAGLAGEGNANGFAIDQCRVIGCRNGLMIDGADVNAGTVTGLDVSANRQWGIWDSSFLGNSYIGCHSASNGWDGAIASVPTACVANGNRYYVKAGQAAGASTNAPSGSSADNQWWGYIGAGGTYYGVVDWASGTVFRDGGAYRTDDPNARTIFVGCYSEGDQNPSQLTAPTLLIGGLHGAGTAGYGGQIEAVPGALVTKGGLQVNGALNARGSANTIGSSSGAASDTYLSVDNSNAFSFVSFRSFYGGVQSNDGQLMSWRDYGIILRSKNATQLAVDNATGGFEVRANQAALTTPGATLGYGAGAGGSVTQATSKATAVTLDRACGRIVMHGAALAAGAAASFTLNCAALAAGDTLVVTIAGGASAGAYAVQADLVSAGSCRISLRNLSGGSLSEAVALNFAIVKAVAA